MIATAADYVAQILTGTAAQLDIPAGLLQLADDIYADLSGYLTRALPGDNDWQFYPQGSAAIGTGVMPQGNDEWDIDAVAEVAIGKEDITQSDLKNAVGQALQDYATEKADDPRLGPTGIEPGRRCWTLSYRHPFHVDVLPAIPNRDKDAPPTGIWLADRDMFRWQPGNPRGYAEWFMSRMYAQFVDERAQIAKAASVTIDDIPAWQVKTTLQREVQILKLHRNAFFASELDKRPPSCVITTLCGLSYAGETSLLEALMNAAEQMPRHLTRTLTGVVLENPAQPGDDLADRWSSTPGAVRRLTPWLDDLRETLDQASGNRGGSDSIVKSLSGRFDESLLQKAAATVRQGLAPVAALVSPTLTSSRSTGRFGPVPPTPARPGRAG
jgi:hypothetical protein